MINLRIPLDGIVHEYRGSSFIILNYNTFRCEKKDISGLWFRVGPWKCVLGFPYPPKEIAVKVILEAEV